MVMAKLALIWISYILIIRTIFFSIMLLFLFLYLVVRWIDQVVFHLICVLNFILVLIFPFYLKAYLCCTEPFRKKLDAFHVTPLLWSNNRHHMPVCVKMISSSVRKVSSMFITHVSGHCLGCCSFGDWSFLGVHPANRWLGQHLYSS